MRTESKGFGTEDSRGRQRFRTKNTRLGTDVICPRILKKEVTREQHGSLLRFIHSIRVNVLRVSSVLRVVNFYANLTLPFGSQRTKDQMVTWCTEVLVVTLTAGDDLRSHSRQGTGGPSTQRQTQFLVFCYQCVVYNLVLLFGRE